MTKPRETSDYADMMRRMVRAYGRRVADGEPRDLADMVVIANELEAQLAVAVQGMRERWGYSWADIARELGCTRQAAQQRFGKVTSVA